MRELVIVIADLYLPAPEHEPLPELATPGLEHVTRFGARAALESGWRDWLARWLGRDELAGVAPATIAAIAASKRGSTDRESTVWIATPMYLVAGLTGLHVDHRSILRPPLADLEQLAADFQKTFRESGFSLEPLPSGDFLMRGASIPETATTEPARSLISEMSQSLPRGAGATALRRLGAEIEMWLHEHPVNQARASRGEPPVSTLWLWGEGPASWPAPAGRQGDHVTRGVPLAFGQESFVRAVWNLLGAESHRLPEQLESIVVSRAERAVVVVEVAEMLHSNQQWTLPEALADLDRRFISPALQALRRGDLSSFVLLANDRQWRVRSVDRFKWWRRPLAGLKGLQ